MTPQASYDALDAWIDQHFDEEVRFLQALVRVPTDTPPGNNDIQLTVDAFTQVLHQLAEETQP